jgi:hypothetical protein
MQGGGPRVWGTRPCAVPLESVDKLRLPNQQCQCNSLQLHIDMYINHAYASRAHAKHDLPVSKISWVGVILEIEWEGVKEL